MFRDAPRPLVTLFGVLLVLRLLLAFVTPGAIVFALLKVGLLALFCWKALQSKESAAKGLSILLLIGAALDIHTLLGGLAAGLPVAYVLLAFPLYQVGLAAYVFRSKAVKAFFAANAYSGSFAR